MIYDFITYFIKNLKQNKLALDRNIDMDFENVKYHLKIRGFFVPPSPYKHIHTLWVL